MPDKEFGARNADGHCPGGCCAHAAGPSATDIDTNRRAALGTLAGAALAAGLGCGGHAHAQAGASGGAADSGESDRPRAGDWLVPPDGDGSAALKPQDLKVGEKQRTVLAWDPTAKRARAGSRLNRIIVTRIDPADMDPETRARAADGGVVAYSSVCTHQACEVNAWRAAEKTLLCFCHFTQFAPGRSGAVTAGPATRPLPALPLTVTDGRLVVAGPFSSPPGGTS